MANSGAIWQNGEWITVSKSSTRSHRVGVNGTARPEGGKRKGKSLKVDPSTFKSGNVTRDMLAGKLEVDPLAKVHTVARGRRVKMITWIDPSVKRN